MLEEIKSCGWKKIFFWLFGGCQKFSFAERSLISKLYLFIYFQEDRFALLTEWYDPTSALLRRYQLFYYPRDGSVEMVRFCSSAYFLSLFFSAWRCVYECSFLNPEYEYLVVEIVNSLFVLINSILMKISDFFFSISEKYTCFTVWCKEPADISEKDQIQWPTSGGLIYWESSERVLTTATSDRLWGSVHSKQTRQ